MFRFKEFLLVFYGAHWCQESRGTAKNINGLMTAVNPEENEGKDPAIEVFYLSNDSSSDEFNRFYLEQLELNPWCTLQWEDEEW